MGSPGWGEGAGPQKGWSSLRAPTPPGPSLAPPSTQWSLTLQMLVSEERPLWPPGPLSQVTVCLSSTAIERL